MSALRARLDAWVASWSSEAALALFALAAGPALTGVRPWRRRAGALLSLTAAFLGWALAYKPFVLSAAGERRRLEP